MSSYPARLRLSKTTMLNCLSAAAGPRERIVSVEEIFELQIPQRDVVGLQCRQSSLEGTGEIPLRRLVKEALRMRPDRLIVGEVREAESLDMLIALNSGLPGPPPSTQTLRRMRSPRSALCPCWLERTSPQASSCRPSPPASTSSSTARARVRVVGTLRRFWASPAASKETRSRRAACFCMTATIFAPAERRCSTTPGCPKQPPSS